VNREQAQSFDRVARDYDRLGELSPGGAVGPWLERGLPAAGRRALDLGCGTGRHAVLLARRFEQVDAVDVSGPMIEVARARRPRPNISYRQADLHDLSDTGRYDLIVSTMTLHHVPDLHAALRLIRGLLAPGGRMLIADMYDLEPGGGWSPLALRGRSSRCAPGCACWPRSGSPITCCGAGPP
jgi:2-polyprenyl-3-methyl-5-hydroxy-6-metoxy-1,4-benzoquinol methylase